MDISGLDYFTDQVNTLARFLREHKLVPNTDKETACEAAVRVIQAATAERDRARELVRELYYYGTGPLTRVNARAALIEWGMVVQLPHQLPGVEK